LPDEPPANSASAEVSAPSRHRIILFVAFALAAVWILGLIVLALISANPVTLNLRQIQHSDYVVSAVRPKSDSTTVTVQKEWKRGQELGEITVTNLADVRMPANQEFLVPLQRLGGTRYRITPTTLPNEAPLIYRATQQAEAQLSELLKTAE
jgi:hypothetical protein